MKILTKEEEQAHYTATLQGGIGGGIGGVALGLAGVYAATRRYSAFRSLTLPLKAFLVTSSGTFAGKSASSTNSNRVGSMSREEGWSHESIIVETSEQHKRSVASHFGEAIISADKYSRAFEASRHPEKQYEDEAERERQQVVAAKSPVQRAMDWGKENRYPIVGASWVASMGIALALVGRNPYLSTSQKIVQARVYAQGLTLAVLVATAAFEIGDRNEGEGRWETVKIVDPNDPTHKHLIEKKVHHESYAGEDLWRDMVETEERKIKEREESAHEQEESHRKAAKDKPNRKIEHDDGPSNKEEHEKKHHVPAGDPRPKSLP